MPHYSVAEAKNTLPRLIDRALAGEEVVITRHGKVVAELVTRKEFDREAWLASLDRLRELRESGPTLAISSVQLLRDMYDESPW